MLFAKGLLLPKLKLRAASGGGYAISLIEVQDKAELRKMKSLPTNIY